MNESFMEGFEKGASKLKGAAAGIAALGAALGGGALIGHGADVANKLDAAKHGKSVERRTWIQKNPKKAGAASLGIAPTLSQYFASQKRNRDNPKTRKVMDDHPYAAALQGN